MNDQIEIFLGGRDAEMDAIKEIAAEHGITTHDAKLGWGAKASVYLAEIERAIASGKTPVLVELTLDLPPELLEHVKIVDHHNERSGEAASIIQIVEIIGAARTRLIDLIAANDTGYIPALNALGASTDEIAAIRAKDRAAQGISQEQERQAEDAITKMARFPELNDLIVVRLPHSKSATITDRLYNQQGRQNILIISEDGETNYFGDGILCKVLGEKFGGWTGGAGLGKAGETAFWGGTPDQTTIEHFIKTANQVSEPESGDRPDDSSSTANLVSKKKPLTMGE